MILEIFGGMISGSLSLISDAWHMLRDLLALILCLFACKMAVKHPTMEKTFGYYRVEIVSAKYLGLHGAAPSRRAVESIQENHDLVLLELPAP